MSYVGAILVKISVLMSACNPGPFLHDTVASIKHCLRHADYEIILVDDCSDDGQCDKVNGFVQLVKPSSRVGCSGGRSLAARHAVGEVLIICDPHCSFPDGTLEDLARHAIDNETVSQPPVYLEGYVVLRGAKIAINVKRYGLQVGRTSSLCEIAFPILHGSIYAMNRRVYNRLAQLPPLPGVWGGWELFYTTLAYRMGFFIDVIDTKCCTHRKYRGKTTLPFSVPDGVRERNLHWYYASCLPHAYEVAFKRMLDGFYRPMDMTEDFESPTFRWLSQWIQDKSERSEQWFLQYVARIQDIETDERIQRRMEALGI